MLEKIDATSVSMPASATARQLAGSVLELWGSKGSADISARSIVGMTQLPASSIYYHFENIEHLFLTAQQLAIEEARIWCRHQVDQLADIEQAGLDALAPVLAGLIDEWCNRQRNLALAWRECHLLAARNVLFAQTWQCWCTLWLQTWSDICARFGIADKAEIVAFFFDSESQLNLVHWRPLIDRACLEEICAGLVSWLAGRSTTEGFWRRTARRLALHGSSASADSDEIGMRVTRAAARVLQREGVGALTHRNVAAQAKVSVGAVSNRLRTRADIVRAAFERVYEIHILAGSTAPEDEWPQASAPAQALPGDDRVDPALALLEGRTNAGLLLAFDEIIVATARNPQLSDFAPQMRYLRGRWGGSILKQLLGRADAISTIDATIFSELQSGLLRNNVGIPIEKARARTSKSLEWTREYFCNMQN